MKEPVQIRIGETEYHLDLKDVSSIQAMPWSDRKQLIDVLEAIQQADHIKTAEPKKEVTPEPQSLIQRPQPQISSAPDLDPEIKKSDADIDAVMNRLLLESGPKRNVPDKGQAYKWLFIIAGVILVLAFLF